MRRSALLFLLATVAAPLFAARSVSIAQLEQQLAAQHGKPDADTAWQIADMQLTERLSAARLAQLQSQVPGEKSRQALATLAADSAFAPPPAAEIPATPTPSIAEQKRILGLAVSYVAKTIPQLPNFVATRKTTRFEDTPQIQSLVGDLIPYQPIHLVGTDSVPVLYQDGSETEQVRAKNQSAHGLVTWGVFGPILGTVLVDAAQSKLSFARWEQEPDGPRAVFGYAVPREKSHYQVDYCCVATQAGSDAANVRPFRKATPYHGEIAVDPATGIIRRLIVQAELKPDDPINKADILVDYGPVEIAGRTYTCPLRSISRSTAQGVQVDPRYHFALANQVQPLKHSLNDVRFTDYHVFRGDTRLLAEAPPASPSESAPNPPAEIQPVAPPTPPAPSAAVETAGIPAPSPTPAPIEQPVVPEINETALTSISEAPSASQTDSNSGFTLRTTSRLVDVAVVAFDKKGHPVTSLKPGDLEIYDNGRKQQVSFFTQAGAGTETTPSADQPALKGHGFSRAESEPENSRASAPEGRSPASADTPGQTPRAANTTILLIDASNVAFADLTYARQEMLRFLKSVAPEERVGLYLLKHYGFEILLEPTSDHAAVATRLAAWMPTAQDLLHAQHEEDRNRQHIEYVQNVTDLSYVNGNVATGQGDIALPVDPQLRSLGDSPERDALAMLQRVARHLAAIPGHKSLVWIASDNVLADFSEKAPSVEKGDKHLDPLALHAREALNDAQVSVYPLDVSQLEAGGVNADLQHANVQLKPTTNETVQLLMLPPGEREEAQEQLNRSRRDINPGRVTAKLQQDTHPIQGTFRELAEATGGRAFRRSGDIASELNQIVADGRAAYLLAFRPDTQPDGQYHVITVKTAQPGVTLRYRAGYLYEKEAATMRDRIRQAIWDARDGTDIGVRAQVTGAGTTQIAKLTISAADVALAQHADRWTDKLHLLLVIRNDSDLKAKVGGRTLELQLKPATYQRALKDGIEIDQPIPTPQQSESIRILVIDENSGRIGAITVKQ
jgi:VWFA-related protein